MTVICMTCFHLQLKKVRVLFSSRNGLFVQHLCLSLSDPVAAID